MGYLQYKSYAFHSGVPLAILTDGQEWNFFLPGEQGDYGERRVYKLDLVEREIGQCVERFERYLLHDAVASGAAIRNAREDYQNVAKKRQIQAALPEAWHRLISEEESYCWKFWLTRLRICAASSPIRTPLRPS